MFEDSNAIYHNLNEKETEVKDKWQLQFFKFSGLEIPFSPLWKKVAINLSGGADSACLTYLLCQIIQNNNFDCKIDVITNVRCWTTRTWQQPISLEVYNKLKSMYPNIIGDRHENFITPELEHGVSGNVFRDLVYTNVMRSGDQVSVYGFNEYCFYKHKINAIFNATTKNPKDTDFPKKMNNREKLAKDGTLFDLIIEKNDTFICHPFRFVDKSFVIAQYYINNIVDLLDVTRSCEGDVTHPVIKQVVPSYKDYNPSIKVPECNTCFWCLERKWAFSKLNETLEQLKNE